MTARKVQILVTTLAFLSVAAGAFGAQEGTDRPPFTEVPMMCFAGPYVAFVPLAGGSLIVIPIGRNGIAPTQTIQLNGNGVIGIKCEIWGVELLVRENGSGPLSRLPFRIQDGTVVQEPGQVVDFTIPDTRISPRPNEITRLLDDYSQWGPRGGPGDWFVRLPGAGSPEHPIYAIHFVSTEKRLPHGLESTLNADLVEQDLDFHVTKSVPLVRSKLTEELGDDTGRTIEFHGGIWPSLIGGQAGYPTSRLLRPQPPTRTLPQHRGSMEAVTITC